MKRVIALVIAVIVAASAVIVAVNIFSGDSAKKSNATSESKVAAKLPVLSHSSGFYDSEFDLSIDVPKGCKVYYTTDCTLPDENSQLYTKPVHISDATPNQNKYASRDDFCILNNDRVKAYNPELYDEAIDTSANTDKCTIIRAVLVDGDGKRSDTVTASYFVNLGDKEEYKDVSVISLVAQPEDLFGYDDGIMVLGRRFDEYEKKYLLDPSAECDTKPFYFLWDANYRNDKDVLCDFDYFESSDDFRGSDTAELSLKGTGSKACVQKGFNLTAKKKTTGSNYLSVNIMTDKKEKGVSLFSGGNDIKYKFNELVGCGLAENLNLAMSSYKPCQVFINGEYFGFYYLQSRCFNGRFYETEYGVDRKSVSIVKVVGEEFTFPYGNEEDYDDYMELRTFVTNYDMSDEGNFAVVESKLDIDSLIDYYCTEIYIDNYDWPNNNYAIWKSSDSSSPYGDGKRRFLLFDTNVEKCMTNYTQNTLFNTINCEPFFASLLNNDGFRKSFTDRMTQLMKTDFSYSEAQRLVNGIYDDTLVFMQSNFRRYYGSNITADDYRKRAEQILLFYKNREEQMTSFLQELQQYYS